MNLLYSCPQLNISGFTHPVTEYFLDELKQMLPPKPGQEQQWLPGNQDSKRFKLANDVNAEVWAVFNMMIILCMSCMVYSPRVSFVSEYCHCIFNKLIVIEWLKCFI